MDTNSTQRLRTRIRVLSAVSHSVPAQVSGSDTAHTTGPSITTATNRDTHDGAREGRTLDVPTPAVIDLDLEFDLEMDTITMPVVGDHVHYRRGSGHLIGLEGVVVTDDRDPDLPSGLRYVLFDGEDWPKVVGVGNLDRA